MVGAAANMSAFLPPRLNCLNVLRLVILVERGSSWVSAGMDVTLVELIDLLIDGFEVSILIRWAPWN